MQKYFKFDATFDRKPMPLLENWRDVVTAWCEGNYVKYMFCNLHGGSRDVWCLPGQTRLIGSVRSSYPVEGAAASGQAFYAVHRA